MVDEGADKSDLIASYYTGQTYFVETGCGRAAETLQRVEERELFDHAFSIEVDHFNYLMGLENTWRLNNVTLIHSGSEYLSMFLDFWKEEPCLFCLDAHSTDPNAYTPIREELAAIFYQPWGHTILIDDARLFDEWPAWPDLSWVLAEAEANGFDHEVKDDVIRLVPR